MQDSRKNKKKTTNKPYQQMNIKKEVVVKENREETLEDLTRACGNNDKCSVGCQPYIKCKCECGCQQGDKCEPCKLESEECIKNVCATENCCRPITPQRFCTSNAVPYAIEAERIFDSILFQNFTDAVGPNGEPVGFEYEVVEVNGPIPSGGDVNITIEEVCLNYEQVEIHPGTISLEDYKVRKPGKPIPDDCEIKREGKRNPNKTDFTYFVEGKLDRECCCDGKGKSVLYKERGLRVRVCGLTLELRGKCGCTNIVAIAKPVLCSEVDECEHCEYIKCIEFIFNTLSSNICVPASGESLRLRQQFRTSLTVDCIGKALLRKEAECRPCEYHFELIIPNGIDVILCLQEVVSTLITDRIVVLGSPVEIKPRLVDTFNQVCNFPDEDCENKC